MPDLELYIQKILDLKDQATDQRLTLEERKALAFDLGLTESDWERLEASYAEHVTRGKTFAKYQNWDDAIEQFEQAYALNPYDTDLLFEMAQTFEKRWLHGQKVADRERARELAAHVLEVEPGHEGAVKLIGDLRTRTAPAQHKKALTFLLLLIAAVVLASVIVVWALMT